MLHMVITYTKAYFVTTVNNIAFCIMEATISIGKTRGFLYGLARILGDVNAVKNGKLTVSVSGLMVLKRG